MSKTPKSDCDPCSAYQAIRAELASVKAENEKLKSLETLQQQKDNALMLALDTLTFVQQKAPGYDWNADPLSLTLKTGEAFSAIKLALIGKA